MRIQARNATLQAKVDKEVRDIAGTGKHETPKKSGAPRFLHRRGELTPTLK